MAISSPTPPWLRCALLALYGTAIAFPVEAVAADDGASDDDTLLTLEDFSDPLHVWRTFGDPHMGGVSDGSFTVDRYEGVGRFFGSIKELPQREDGRTPKGAIGFFRAEAGALGDPSPFPDARTCDGLRLTLRSEGWGYEGFLLGFGTKKPPTATGKFSRARGYSAALTLPQTLGVGSDEYIDVDVPFTAFTMQWNAGTGGEIATCADSKENCPDDESKADPRPIMVYAKGVAGTFDLRIKSISAYGCDPNAADSSAMTTEDMNDVPDEIVVEDFARPGGPMNEWKTMDDPVMGGKSYSSLEIERGVAAKFEGYCAIVPSLKAPGFITMSTGKSGRFAKGKPAAFPDISNCDRFQIEARSGTDYKGYYISFGTEKAEGMRHGRGYKAHVEGLPFQPEEDKDTASGGATGGDVPNWAGRQTPIEFGTVDLPFASFSSDWDEGTGVTKVECSEDDPQYCPTLAALRNIETISLWGEGVEGNVALDVKSIKALGCKAGRYSKVLRSIGVEDEAKTGIKAFAAMVLPGAAFVAVCVALLAVFKSWRVKRRSAAVTKGETYGEVPPISSAVEVDVLRSELVEMRKVMGAIQNNGGAGAGGTEGVQATKSMIV